MRLVLTKAVLLLSLALTACSASSADAAGGEPPPPEMTAREALEALEVTPDQQDQLLALMGKFAIVLSKSGKARRAFTNELLDAMTRGRVNKARIDPLRADFEKAIREATPEVLALINELHAILTRVQRAKLVDTMAARFADAEKQRKARNQEMIERLDIGLMQKVDIAQALADKLGDRRADFEQMKADAKAAGEAFKKDDFDANELAIAQRDLGKLYLESIVILVDALAPVLEHEQRVKLVGIIKYRLDGGGR